MDLQEFSKLATMARRHIVRFMPEWPDDLAGACGVASYHLMKLANMKGVNPSFVAGWYIKDPDIEHAMTYGHCWLEYDGHIVDITATQFSEEYEPIHIIQSPNPHYKYDDMITTDPNMAWRNISDWVHYPHVLDSIVEYHSNALAIMANK